MDVALLYSRLLGVTVMNGVKFEFNDIIISLKSDSERILLKIKSPPPSCVSWVTLIDSKKENIKNVYLVHGIILNM